MKLSAAPVSFKPLKVSDPPEALSMLFPPIVVPALTDAVIAIVELPTLLSEMSRTSTVGCVVNATPFTAPDAFSVITR